MTTIVLTSQGCQTKGLARTSLHRKLILGNQLPTNSPQSRLNTTAKILPCPDVTAMTKRAVTHPGHTSSPFHTKSSHHCRHKCMPRAYGHLNASSSRGVSLLAASAPRCYHLTCLAHVSTHKIAPCNCSCSAPKSNKQTASLLHPFSPTPPKAAGLSLSQTS